MNAPAEILATWRKFDAFPMETLTKAWYYGRTEGNRQREVSLMEEHRNRYGLSGNCFDLAIWLLDEFRKDGIAAYPVGNDLNTEEAHAAIIALDERGHRFLCDLGDQWLQPVLIDRDAEAYTNERLSGFFPAADVQVYSERESVIIQYWRPNGKWSSQTYLTAPVELGLFLRAAEFSQNHVYPKPLVEVRLPYKQETAHWEFDDWMSFTSTTEGLLSEPEAEGIEGWADRIRQKTGADQNFLVEALKYYWDRRTE